MKTDAAFRFGKLRCEERFQVIPERYESLVVLQQSSIDFGQLLENRRVCGDLFPHMDKGADDVNAHGRGLFALEYICRLEGTVLRKGGWWEFGVLAAL